MAHKCTIIIPNYNHARYLPQRIESVLQQTYRECEILILDDYSTDNSREVIEHYAMLDNRIRVVYNDQNSGSTFRQWNKGIGLAQGEYIWLAESDDYAEPELLAALVAQLDAHPRVALAYCDSISVDERNTFLREWKYGFCDALQTDLWKQDFVADGLDFTRRFMSFYNLIPNASAVLLRKSVIEQVGRADESTRLTGDWLYWIAILAQGDVAYIHQPYNYFRTHTNNVRSKTLTNGILLVETSRVLLKMRQTIGDTTENRQATITLLREWFNGAVYGSIPAHRNAALARNMSELLGSGKLLAKEWLRFVFSHRLRGARLLLGEGFLYKVFPKVRRIRRK